MDQTLDVGTGDGLGALSLLESLLLSLGELKIMTAMDIDGLLVDVAETHRNAADLATGPNATLHRKVAEHAERIRAGGNAGEFGRLAEVSPCADRAAEPPLRAHPASALPHRDGE